MELRNKIALVTGAGVRLGQEIALYLAQQGMHVAIHYHRSAAGAQETFSRIKKNHTQPGLYQADLKQLGAITTLVTRIQQEMGPISVLINNAADFFDTPFFEVTEAQWEHLFALNLKAPFFLSQQIGAGMKQQGEGKIVNLVDVSVERPWVNFLPYCTTKAGLVTLTKGIAKALAPQVQVNGIAPGTVLPPPSGSEINQALSIEHSLLKRMGSPEDIIRALDFLLHSDFVTGTVLAVDGGRLLV